VVTKLDGFRRESSLFTWLCACCRNEIRMHFRTQGRRPKQVELDDPGVQGASALQQTWPDQTALRKESSELVHQTLDDLPPHYAKALEWKYIEKSTVAEIAQRLDLSPKAAESLLTRARAAFRASFEQLNSPLETRPDDGLLGGSQ